MKSRVAAEAIGTAFLLAIVVGSGLGAQHAPASAAFFVCAP
jgi:hypothetical protein